MNAKVSVIITCYNDGAYLEEAIQSVQTSIYPNTEILIVDDCSQETDTREKLVQLEQKGYTIIRLSENKGVGNARNKGIEVASGSIILPLDGDDRLKPDYISKAVSVLENKKNIGVVYCNVQRFGTKTSVRVAPEYNLSQLLAGNFIASCSFFRKEDWQKTKGYDTQMPNYEDWEFWVSLAESGIGFYHLNEVLFEYRAKETSKISKCLDPNHRAGVVAYVVNKHLDFYKKYVPEIIAYLHLAISSTEQQLADQNLLLAQNGATELFEKLRYAEDELLRRTAYYENSFFWKLKKLFDKIKP